jgi:hypothetical protein
MKLLRLMRNESASLPLATSVENARASFEFQTEPGDVRRTKGSFAGPGFRTTDTTDPLNVRFHCNDSTNGDGGSWSPTSTVNYKP